jgi:Ala-tRNA(Pro) deacylase
MNAEAIMTIAASVQDCLAREGVHYDTIAHERTRDSSHSAHAAHIPGDRLAKCVLLEDDKGFLMAVVPASHKVDLGAVQPRSQAHQGTITAHPI